MNHATSPALVGASTLDSLPAELLSQVRPHLQAWAECIETFRRQPPTPTTAYQFENDLAQQLRALGQALVAWTFNHLEPDDLHDLPAQIIWDNQAYRRRPKSGNRSLDSLFGPLRLQRVRYEPVEAGEPSLFPLEMALGIAADRATAALAERVGHAAAAHTPAGVRALLVQQHGVHWSVQTLRKVTAHLSAGLAEHRQAAQAAKLVEALQQATTSVGPHAPTVCVGRDGVMVPLRDRKAYGEASAATISVLDRRGRRRYTAYLGRMPEHEQRTLSQQLTSLLLALLTDHLVFHAGAETLLHKSVAQTLLAAGIDVPIIKDKFPRSSFHFMVFDSDNTVRANYCDVVLSNRIVCRLLGRIPLGFK